MAYTPTQIATTTYQTPFGFDQRNRCPILATPDGYKIIPYTDGTNLFYAVGTSGGTWTTHQVGTSLLGDLGITADFGILPVTSTTATIVACIVSGGAATFYTLAYSGAGTLGTTLTTTTFASLLSSTPTYIYSVKFAALSTGPSLMYVFDGGSTWYIGSMASSATAGTINTLDFGMTPYSAPTLAGASHDMNLIVQKPPSSDGTANSGLLYLIAPGSSSWLGASFPLTWIPKSGSQAPGAPSPGAMTTSTPPFTQFSSYGAALCLADTTSNPGVDIAVPGGQLITRSSSGSYSAPRNLGTGGPYSSPVLSQNAATGNEILLLIPSGSSHISSVVKTNGAWGQVLQQDASSSYLVGSGFAAIRPSGYGTMGPAVAYTDGTTPYPMLYDDAGSAAGAVAPGAPTNLTITSSGTTGSGPFTATTATPTLQFTYNETNTTDPMGAYRVVYSTGGATTWDSGKVGITGGPAPGGTYSVAYGGPGLSANTTYSVVAYAYDSLGGLASPASTAISVYIAGATPTPVLDTSSLTALNPTLTFDYAQAQGTPCASYDVQFSQSGSVLYDTLPQTPATTIKAATLATALTTTGASSISASEILDSGTTIVLDTGSNAEVLTTGAVTGAGPYTVPISPATTKTHAAGAQIATRFTTPPFPIQQSVPNNATLAATLTTTVSTPVGISPWSGSSNGTVTTAFPAPPAPDSLVVTPIPGMHALDPAYLSLRWNQAAASGSQPAPVSTTIYLRESGTLAWTAAGTLAAIIGTNTARIYSVISRLPYDIAVASISTDGIASAMAIDEGAILPLRLGLNLCDPANPTTSVELGLVQGGGSSMMPQWDAQIQQDAATLFNRTAPVMTMGTLFAYGHSSDLTYVLEPNAALATRRQLQAWLQAGTTLLIRESINQLLFYGVIRKASPSAVAHSSIPAIVLNLAQSDPGSYTSVVTQ